MPHYLMQASYNPEAWSALEKEPEDRTEAIRPVVERLGGRLINGYLSFGDYDIIAIVEMPNDISAAAYAIASAGGGAVRIHKTTPLLTPEEAKQAMALAGGAEYHMPHALQEQMAQEAADLVASVGE
jgi:uncharacterized protein with GYD domain